MKTLIYDKSSKKWWKALGKGYTPDKEDAHRYEMQEAIDILLDLGLARCGEPSQDVMVNPDDDPPED